MRNANYTCKCSGLVTYFSDLSFKMNTLLYISFPKIVSEGHLAWRGLQDVPVPWAAYVSYAWYLSYTQGKENLSFLSLFPLSSLSSLSSLTHRHRHHSRSIRGTSPRVISLTNAISGRWSMTWKCSIPGTDLSDFQFLNQTTYVVSLSSSSCRLSPHTCSGGTREQNVSCT